MAARRRNSGRGMTIVMLSMLIVIVLLTALIGSILVKRDVTNPLMKAEVHTADYIDETGTISGKRGYVEINKRALTAVNARKFAKFTEKVVNTGDYEIFTIVCEDGTGIVYGQSTNPNEVAVYGYINAMGQATETFGYIKNSDGTYKYNAYLN